MPHQMEMISVPRQGPISKNDIKKFAQIVVVDGMVLRIDDERVTVLGAIGPFGRKEVWLEDGGVVLFSEGILPDCLVLADDVVVSRENPALVGRELIVVKRDYPGWPPMLIPLGRTLDVR